MDASRGGDVDGEVTRADTFESRARPTGPERLDAALAHGDGPIVYWEAPDGTRIAGAGAVTVHEANASTDAADRALSSIRYDGPPAARPRMLGGRAFDATHASNGPWSAFPTQLFVLPRHLVVGDDESWWHTVTGRPESLAGAHDELADSVPTARSPHIDRTWSIPDRDAWIERVGDLRDRIADGAFRKVVAGHARGVTFDRTPTPLDWVTHLRETNPGCYIALVAPEGEDVFVTATPERLVERRGATIRSEALAGTVGRGSTSADDARLSNDLRTDEKERHEHRLVVDAIRSNLEALGADVRIDDRRVRRLTSIQHLYTPVTAEHPDAPHILDLVRALHPTPAVGGIPRDDALIAIREMESVDRGWYAGPIGWFDDAGDGSFAIGIRSGVVQGDRGRIFAGAGIVADSDPATEWTEVQWKYRPILDAFPDA